ncbi:acyl carrier protein [Tenacibaculum sp. nBUS_03]|uniref:acyl carrier protein n=1 Tax=Tenacibaculum sp. nBUS_03 TaxID=3395320 RepID=UPI003EBE2AD9
MKSEELAVKSHKLWSDILSNEKINREEDFFDQGGTSLSLIELISKTKEYFSVTLKASDFEEGLSLEIYEGLILKSMNKEPQKVV